MIFSAAPEFDFVFERASSNNGVAPVGSSSSLDEESDEEEEDASFMGRGIRSVVVFALRVALPPLEGVVFGSGTVASCSGITGVTSIGRSTSIPSPCTGVSVSASPTSCSAKTACNLFAAPPCPSLCCCAAFLTIAGVVGVSGGGESSTEDMEEVSLSAEGERARFRRVDMLRADGRRLVDGGLGILFAAEGEDEGEDEDEDEWLTSLHEKGQEGGTQGRLS